MGEAAGRRGYVLEGAEFGFAGIEGSDARQQGVLTVHSASTVLPGATACTVDDTPFGLQYRCQVPATFAQAQEVVTACLGAGALSLTRQEPAIRATSFAIARANARSGHDPYVEVLQIEGEAAQILVFLPENAGAGPW